MLSIAKEMARATGLEPATSGVTGRHSNQLSYARAWAIGQGCPSGEGGIGEGIWPVKQGLPRAGDLAHQVRQGPVSTCTSPFQ